MTVTCASCGEEMESGEGVHFCGAIWLPGRIIAGLEHDFHDSCVPFPFHAAIQEAMGNESENGRAGPVALPE